MICSVNLFIIDQQYEKFYKFKNVNDMNLTQKNKTKSF